MFRKSVMLILMASLYCSALMWSVQANAYPWTMYRVYDYVRRMPVHQLQPYLQNNPLLDIQDENGNTALCVAIVNQDKIVAQKLILLGANINAWCMSYIPVEQLREYGLTRRGARSSGMYATNRRYSSYPSVFTRKHLFALGVVGGLAGTVALVASLHGGGGGSKGGGIVAIPTGSSSSDEKTVLEETKTIPAATFCPDEMELVNGVCMAKEIVPTPKYLAKDGEKISNSENLSYEGSTSAPVVVMQSTGVSASAKDGNVVNLSGASSATNEKTGVIRIVENSDKDLGAIAMYATSAGTINNKGNIEIISKSKSESAAMKVDRDDAKSNSGIGANITNDGTISVTDQSDGSRVLSAISAPGRSITNKGAISVFLEAPSGVTISDGTKGVAQAIYGKNISNQGTISLDTNAVAGNTSNAEAYLIRGFGDTGSVVANDGTLNINLTNIGWNIYGLWTEPARSSSSQTSVKNTGTINVSGKLYRSLGTAKQVYLMGALGGIATIENFGSINVGTSNVPIDVSLGGIMEGMYGFYGTMDNQSKIDFNLYADPDAVDPTNPDSDSNPFTALAMSLHEGTLTNSADITYTFSNVREDFTGQSYQKINLTAIDTLSATVTNNANLTATLSGSSNVGSSFTGMSSTTGKMKNTKLISAISNVDNMNLTAMTTGTGSVLNTSEGRIILKTTGVNANLTGANSAGGGLNEGYVSLVHNGGSGNIRGFDGGNQGVIQIEALNMSGLSRITGGQTYDPIKESGENSDVENTNDASGIINITLKDITAGSVYGYEYYGDWTTAQSYTSANTINVTAKAPERVGSLSVKGIVAQTYEGGKYKGDVSVNREGTMTLDVMGSANHDYRTEVIGISATNSQTTNTYGSVINLKVDLNNSTNHSIIGMLSVDENITHDNMVKQVSKDYGETSHWYNVYKSWNAGTLNLNITGSGATDVYYHPDVPFDVVGMVTNSYALNTGTINLNVASSTAKTAGMVAYYGGMIINTPTGKIVFTGTVNNFTPMYATGHNKAYQIQEDYTVEKDYWATIRNAGQIIIQNIETPLPQGNAYYTTNGSTESSDNMENPPSWGWARRVEKTGDDGYLFDNRSNFEEIGDPVPYEAVSFGVSKTKGNSMNTTNTISQTNNQNSNTANSTEFPSSVSNKSYSMRINDGMRYVSEKGGSFVADGIHLLGDVTAGRTLVQGKNMDTYIANGYGEGAVVGDGDFSDLGLSSESAMFRASYAQNATNSNGADIVMQRKSFYEFVGNTSLASYLERNYQMGNNVAFFDQLKSFDQLNQLNQSLDKFTGKDVLSRFNFEDLTMMKELNFDMNDKIFHNSEDVMETTGTVKSLAFKGDTGSKAKYSLLYKKQGNYSMGVGMAFANIRSDGGDKENKRQEMLYQMNVPIGTKILGANFVTSPRLGYARGTYNRTGFNDTNYKGVLEKRVFGLANEIRYPLVFGSWTVEPVSEFNILGYNQRGQEDKKSYSLQIKSQNTYSVEGGVGLYVNKTFDLPKDSILKLSSGVVAYHEFADPYRLDVGMMGMDGSFTLRDETHSQNHAVVRAGFDYNRENLSLYGALTSYIDDEVRTNIKSGMNWKF